MKIFLAKDSGYCFGVRDAVNMAYETADKDGEVYMLGTIVHNEKVIEDLDAVGTKVVDSLDDIPAGSSVLFRAHGTSPSVWKNAKRKKLNIVDATCPLVTEIHQDIKELAKEGRRCIIIGDHGHDEVIGIASQIKNPIIIANKTEAMELKKIKKAGVVSQSTQMIENVRDILDVLVEKVYDLRFVNTICFPTRRNHEQIKDLAINCDIMIIIGSFTSANSKRLTQLSKERNKRSYQVTSAGDLKDKWFQGCTTVGISAGASTPDEIINDVIKEIKIISNSTEEEVVYDKRFV